MLRRGLLVALTAQASSRPHLHGHHSQLERDAAYAPWKSSQWQHDSRGNIVVDTANFKQEEEAPGAVIEQWHQTQNERKNGVSSWTNVRLNVGDSVVPGIMFAQQKHRGQGTQAVLRR